MKENEILSSSLSPTASLEDKVATDKVAKDKFYTSPKWASCDKILNIGLVCTVYVFKCYSSANRSFADEPVQGKKKNHTASVFYL